MGSGKSEVAVIDLLPLLRLQNFIAVLGRKTTPLLKGAGGLLSKCRRIFAREFKDDPEFTYAWKDKESKFVFYKKEKRNGRTHLHQVSEVFLKHSEYDTPEWIEKYWQSVEASLIVLDEATQYTWDMVNYIIGRMRNPSCPQYKPKLKMTCNPMYNHFLRKWVEPYLFPDGTPDRSKDGLVRYMQLKDGEFYFADTKEAVADYCNCRLEDVLTFQFISANVFDNKVLQEVDPSYVAKLMGLKGVERKRKLEGNWYAKEEGSSYFKREWMVEIDSPPDHTQFSKIVRAYDFAGTMPTEQNRNPDYTTSVKMGKLKTGDYVILDITKTRIRFGEWKQHILENAMRDGRKCEIVIPQDPNIQAKANSIRLARDIIEYGFSCVVRRAAAGKLEDFKPFAAIAQLGCVSIVKGCGNDLYNKIYNDLEFFYSELEIFTGERSNKKNAHDDKQKLCRQ